jgi:hypothetical protein
MDAVLRPTREQLSYVLSGQMITRTISASDSTVTDNSIVTFIEIDDNGVLVITVE